MKEDVGVDGSEEGGGECQAKAKVQHVPRDRNIIRHLLPAPTSQ